MRTSLKGPGAACAVALSSVLAALPGAVAAHASGPRPSSRCETDIARAVAAQLQRAPAGRPTSPDTLSYDNGAEVITFRPPSCGAARRNTAHDCDEDGVPDNAVCLYDRRAFEGSRQAIKVTGTRKLNGSIVIMSIKNDRPFIFLVKRTPTDRGTCFSPGEGYGDTDQVAGQRWVNAHPGLRGCGDL
ncbi:hypothetical protein OHA77_33940 [Streptosporangium sp. NBC_01639]|uniref:hypothetical protein n=1 Tax=unclassified Streptosporangium TaxID=2632669 RepID=UPI002DDAAB9D|nr:hypothetical protein [Streptosporangium sp. NBC_01756]WSC87731.1 hypothetical protein OIE48_05830 [Streptosporangium sp. NBC_01756]WTD53592.1 hypothetical protein OHA77_33940 [Streptosporangium sp. NBC_01639]